MKIIYLFKYLIYYLISLTFLYILIFNIILFLYHFKMSKASLYILYFIYCFLFNIEGFRLLFI